MPLPAPVTTATFPPSCSIAASWQRMHGVSEQQKTSHKAVQQRRLSAALRENLKRRKAQAKDRAKDRAKDPAGRAAAPAAEQDADPHDSAGIAADKRKS